jgi:DNA-binding CsgD family transcriptional regulator
MIATFGLAGKPLTDRELEILVGIAEGRSDVAIARGLFISPATVKGHIGRIKVKLAAASRPHMVAIAYQRGILTLGAAA